MAKKGCMKNTRLDKLLGRDGLVRLIDAAGPSLFSKGYERALRHVLGYEITSDCHTAMTGGMPSAALNHAPAGGLVAAESAGADCAGAGADGAGPDVAQDDDDGDGDGDPDSDRPRPRSKTPSPQFPAALLPFAHTSHYVALGRSRIYQLIEAGQFPKPIKVGSKSVRWVRAELDAWITAQAARREVGAA